MINKVNPMQYSKEAGFPGVNVILIYGKPLSG